MLQTRWIESDLKLMKDYLRQKVGIFEEVRKKMNVGDDLGLAILPECNGYTAGTRIDIFLKDRQEWVYFYYPTETPGRVRIELTKIPSGRMIVNPIYYEEEDEDGAHLVSIYFFPGIVEIKKRGLTLDQNWFQAPEEVITGLMAHECAEHLWDKQRNYCEHLFPSTMHLLLLKMGSDRKYSGSLYNQLVKQCPSDFIASYLGYKQEILSLHQFLINQHRCQEDFLPNSGYRSKQELIEELQVRIDFIKGAC